MQDVTRILVVDDDSEIRELTTSQKTAIQN